PRRALRLAATALGAGREVEDVLPGEVPDGPGAEGGLLVEVVDVVKGDRLATRRERLDRAERRTTAVLALEPDVEPGGEAVPGHAHGEVRRDDDEPDHRGGDLHHRDEVDDVLQRPDRLLAGREEVAEELRDREVEAVGVLGGLA